MKILHKLLFAGLAFSCCSAMMVSCKDKDETPLPDISTKTYTGNNLDLYYNGEQLSGKTCILKVSDGKADLTFNSSLDLSQVSGLGMTENLVCPGVLPGNLDLNISSPLVAGDGCYNIAGSGATSEVEYKFSGSIYEDKLVFNLYDCKLKNQALAGKVFVPSPIEKSGLEITSLPFHLEWELDPVTGIDIPLSGLLKTLAVAPIIPVYNNTAYMSVSQALISIIKTIALTPSGNIPVMYISTLGGAAHLATTTGNMLQYTPTPSGIKLYVNPLDLYAQFLLVKSNNKYDEKFDFAEMLKKSPSSKADAGLESGGGEIAKGEELLPAEIKKALLQSLLETLAPQIANGIPMTLTPTLNGADIYFDTPASVNFLASIMTHLLENPQVSEALQSVIASLELPGLTPEQVNAILTQLPTFLINTTRLELGLSLSYYGK